MTVRTAKRIEIDPERDLPTLLAYDHGCSVPTLNAVVFNAGPACERVRVNGFNRHWPRLALLAIENWRGRNGVGCRGGAEPGAEVSDGMMGRTAVS